MSNIVTAVQEMQQQLTPRSQNVLNPRTENVGWNYRNKQNCPIDVKFLIPSIM